MKLKLTPTQRAAMLAEYERDEEPIAVLAGRWGISPGTINAYRRQAGISGRCRGYRRDLIPVQPVDVSVEVLPVFPVRLVSRPGEEKP